MAFSDFIDELESPGKEATPSMAEVLTRSTKAQLYDTRVCLPAEVIKYDYKKQSVDVQPYLKQTFEDGEVMDMAQIFSVPVVFPRGAKSFITFPIKKGDTVMLVFCDRSLDKWKSTGGRVDPQDKRMHHLSDAFAIPGGYSFKHAADVENEKDVIITNDKSSIFVKPNGHFEIKNQTAELIELLNDIFQAIREAFIIVEGNPEVLINPAFPALAAKLKSFQEI